MPTKYYQCKEHRGESSYFPRFCAICGKPLELTSECIKCGYPLLAYMDFCPECGTKRPNKSNED